MDRPRSASGRRSVVLQRWDIDEDYSRGGYMSTPPMLLNGTATLTFPCRNLATEDASIWCRCASEHGPGDDQDDSLPHR